VGGREEHVMCGGGARRARQKIIGGERGGQTDEWLASAYDGRTNDVISTTWNFHFIHSLLPHYLSTNVFISAEPYDMPCRGTIVEELRGGRRREAEKRLHHEELSMLPNGNTAPLAYSGLISPSLAGGW
jgi:hypothetical protein